MAFRKCREADCVRHIPIVLTTTNKHALDSIVGSSGAMEIIGKPCDMDQLAAAVNRAIASAAEG